MMDQVENGFAIGDAGNPSGTPVADSQAPADEVIIATDEPVETGESQPVEPEGGAGTPPANTSPADEAQTHSQKDIDRAFGQRLAQERRRLENTDAYKLGTQLLQERANREGITPVEAYQRIQQERLDATAEAYAKDPKQFYKDLLHNNFGGQPSNQNGPETPNMQADRIGREIAAMQQQGTLPAGFDIRRDLDQDTYNNIVEYGAAAAMRIWKAEHANNVQAELQRRQAGPAPMRPTSGRSQQSGPVDFTKLSTEQFRRIEEQVKNAEMEGRTVRFS